MSYIAPERLKSLPEGWITIPPDLAVEVISPNDLFEEVEHKVIEYLDAGVRMVWGISPMNCWVRVFEPGRVRQFTERSDELSGGDVLPGFRLPIRNLFSQST